MSKSVTVYSTPGCAWCMKTRQWLDGHDILYREIDVSADTEARERLIALTGQMAVPVIDIDGEIAIGYDEIWLKEKLVV